LFRSGDRHSFTHSVAAVRWRLLQPKVVGNHK